MVTLDDGSMLDIEICEQYPELSDMGFEEEFDGYLRYFGDLEIDELEEDLQERGFRVEVDGELW